MRIRVIAAALVIAWALMALPAQAQWKELPETGSQPQFLPDRTKMVGQSGLGPLLSATLADAHKNAREHKAVVEVHTDGVQLVDPATANYAPRLDQAHLQYQLDGGPPVNSTSNTMTFTGLAPGEHRILVKLVGNDNSIWEDQHTLKVHIPK